MRVSHEDIYAQSWNTNFDPNPFEEYLHSYSQNTSETEYVPFEEPKENYKPPLAEIAKIRGKQTHELEIKYKNEIPQQTHDDFDVYKTKNTKNIRPGKQTQKPLKVHKFPRCKTNP